MTYASRGDKASVCLTKPHENTKDGSSLTLPSLVILWTELICYFQNIHVGRKQKGGFTKSGTETQTPVDWYPAAAMHVS